jgi:hypothetical protein
MDAEAKKAYKLLDQLPYLHKTCLYSVMDASSTSEKKEGQSIGYYTKHQTSIQFKELQHRC